ncbi:MAG: ADOP family duplicated permease [Gemmatimonadota bacterium]
MMPRRPRLPSIRATDRAREADEELQAHLQLNVDDLVADGHDPAEARRMAAERLGDLHAVRDAVERAARDRDRRLGGKERLDGLRRDLVVAVRRMRRRPGHSLLSIGIFALGIGLTTTMFTVVDGVLLRPLGFPEADRLVALHSVAEEGDGFSWVSMGNWYDWDRGNRTLSSSAIHSQEPIDVAVSGVGEPFVAAAVRTHGRFFETMRIPLRVGSVPDSADVAAGGAFVLISESFWSDVLNRQPLPAPPLILDGVAHDVVGVVEAGFEHPQGVELWQPRRAFPQVGMARNNINYRAVGRLAEGATLPQAEADLSSIADGIRASDPEGVYSWGVEVRPLAEEVVGDSRPYLLVLMGAVALVLLIACTNLAALGFARGAERAQEVALRMSLGARRERVVRQLLSEELLLAGLGGLLGVLLAWLSTEALVSMIQDVVPRGRELRFDTRVAAFGALISLLAGALAGLPPAMNATRLGGPALIGRRVARGRGLPGTVLVAGEVALTVLLVTGGTLLLMNLSALGARDLGYEPENLAAVQVGLVSERYQGASDRVLAYWDDVARVVETNPAAESVGLATWAPTAGGGRSFVDVRGDDQPDGGAGYRVIGGEYFEAMRIPLLQGRAFDERDQDGAEPVTIVSQQMADEFWPGQNPIGQRVRAPSMESYFFDGEAPWRTVVGVAGDVRHYGYDSDPEGQMYVPHRQIVGMSMSMTATIRMRQELTAPDLERLRRDIQSLDPSLAVRSSTFEERLGDRLVERRMIMTLLVGFATAGLLLASLGVYGVISHAVARRTREMAIRSALGANRSRVAGLVIGGAMRWVGIGTVMGLVLTYGGRGIIDSLLVDIRSADPRAYLAAAVCLGLVTIAAASIPAARAARVDPLVGLSAE